MQKITLLLFAATFSISSAVAQSPTETEVEADSTDSTQNVKSVGQEQLIQLMQADIIFEREKRQLSNEVALEKLRSELKKIRSDSTPTLVMPTMAGDNPTPVAAVVSAVPEVLAVSQVGGVSKVAVGAGRGVILVDRHEIFDIEGKKYQLVTNSKKRLVVKAYSQ